MYTKEQIKDTMLAKGYKWFDDAANKGYDVNIVGVRNNAPSVADKVTNVFDDHLYNLKCNIFSIICNSCLNISKVRYAMLVNIKLGAFYSPNSLR